MEALQQARGQRGWWIKHDSSMMLQLMLQRHTWYHCLGTNLGEVGAKNHSRSAGLSACADLSLIVPISRDESGAPPSSSPSSYASGSQKRSSLYCKSVTHVYYSVSGTNCVIPPHLLPHMHQAPNRGHHCTAKCDM